MQIFSSIFSKTFETSSVTKIRCQSAEKYGTKSIYVEALLFDKDLSDPNRQSLLLPSIHGKRDHEYDSPTGLEILKTSGSVFLV